MKGDFAFGPYVSIGYYEEVDVTIPAATIMGWGYIEVELAMLTHLRKLLQHNSFE